MNEGKIAKRYAKALLLYAQEQHADEQVYSEMKRLVKTFAATPRFEFTLKNPMVTPSRKLKLLSAAFDNKPLKVVSRFFDLVLANRRESFIYPMSLWYVDLYQRSRNMVPTRLVTAVPPSDAVIAKMKNLSLTVMPGNLMFESEVDPKIEGGFVLYIDTYRLDASVTSQLKRIKQAFVEDNRKIVNA